MKFRNNLLAGLALAVGVAAAHGQDNETLLNILVQKNILTPKEAETVRADLIRENNSADKIKLSGPVTELSLYGDFRLRYQYWNVDPQFDYKAPTGDPGHGDQGSRLNFRLRLSADFKLGSNWFGGFQLTTAQTPDTGSQTYNYGFQNQPIYISRAYAGWKNDDNWLTILVGKEPNPFYASDMMWDPNINPSGFVEQVKLHNLLAGDTHETVSQTPSGRKVVSSTVAPSCQPWELTFVAGQFIFDDNNEALPSGQNWDAFLFEEQVIFKYKFSNDVKFTLAPAYFCYNAAQINGATNLQPFSQANDGLPPGTGETRDLSLIEVPGDVTFKLAGIPTKFLWDVTYNTNGAKRTRDIYELNGEEEVIKDSKGNVITEYQRGDHVRKDDYAYQVGFLFGQNVKAGDWSLLTTYRQVGIAATDPNINCPDYALSRLNVKGWKVSAAYNLSSAVIGQVTYFYAQNLRKDLIGGEATGGSKIADGNNIQLLTVDLNVKF